MRRSLRHYHLILVILLSIALLAGTAFLVAPKPHDGQQPNARAEVQAAWQRARDAGSYQFTADVLQHTIPLPTVTNAGRRSRQDALRLEGQTNLREQQMRLTVWSQGGSTLNAESGVEVRIEGDRAFARRGNGSWEAIDDFTGVFAPEGDFLAFLAAAEDITHAGTETRAGLTFTRYTFRVNGPGFAAYVRDQMEKHMAQRGELPPGVTLDLPRAYVGMTGAGEVWVDADGLPLRQILRLQFPAQNDHRVEAEVTVDFSRFDLSAQKAERQMTAWEAFVLHPLSFDTRRTVRLALFIGMLALTALIAAHSRSRTVYTALVSALIASLVISPLLQSHQAAAFNDRQAIQTQEQEQRQQEIEAQRAIHAALGESNFNPHADPLAAAVQAHAYAPAMNAIHLPTVNTQTAPTTALCRVADSEFSPDNTADSDQDGLTDYQECLLGTDLFYADTDGDAIMDTQEVQGFVLPNQTRRWYTDPRELDSNRDGIGDTQEWFVNAGSNNTPGDMDGDNMPDLFDDDNDGDGVLDKIDLSPFRASTSFTENAPLSLILNGLEPNRPAFVEFQLRPTNRDHLWYAFNVLDWPQGDEEGQMRDVDGATFADMAAAGEDFAPADENGDLKLIPMLEILITGEPDHLPSPAELDNYRIYTQTVQQAGSSTNVTETVKAAYVPLQVVTDQKSGERVAFYGKMPYRPEANWGNAQTARLVWVIQGLVDVCQAEGDSGCSRYEYNRTQVLYIYYDEWFLTGLNVREDHGTDIALIYEDPAADNDRNDDMALTALARGLDGTFLVGRDCVTTAAGGACIRDGQRDLTIAEIQRRFDRMTNGGVLEAERWGIPNLLRVDATGYESRDAAIVTTAMTRTLDVLDTFTAFAPITPTLMFAREERARNINLEEQVQGQTVVWAGAQLTLDFGADGGKQVETIVGVSWTPYQRVNDAWEAMPLEAYAGELERRYLASTIPGEDSDISTGKLVVVQLYYLGLYNGIINIVQNGSTLLIPPQLSQSDQDLRATIENMLDKGLKEALNTLVLGPVLDPAPVWQQLAALRRAEYGIGAHRLPLSQFYSQLPPAARIARTLAKVSTAIAFVAMGLTFVQFTLLIALQNQASTGLRLFNNIISLISATLNAVATVITVVQQIAVKAIDVGVRAATRAVLSGTTATTSSKIAGAIGLIISLGIIWGFFIHSVVSNNIQTGTPEFNVLLATAFAATLVAVVLFLLSLNPIGLIIVSLIAVVDALLTLLGIDFTITGWLTEQIAKAFYGFNEVLTIELDDSEMGALEMNLLDPNLGLRVGNTLVVTSSLTTTVVHDDPDDDFYDNATPQHVTEFWTEDNLKSAKFNYAFSVVPTDNTTTWQTAFDHTYTRRSPFGNVILTQNMHQGTSHQAVVVGQAALDDGINVRPVVQLVTRYDLPGVECERILGAADCDEKRTTGNSASDLRLVFDVFPINVTAFYSLTWGIWALPVPHFVRDDGSFNVRFGEMAFGIQRDHDGDGLLALDFGGNDPSDRKWDNDGDGLSDAYELELRAGGFSVFPTVSDSDGDCQLGEAHCLTDGEEERLGTNPAQIDSDGDSLTDKEEVMGWDFTYRAGSVTRVTSNPLAPDTDGDGINDKAERDLHRSDPQKFPFHPRVFNAQPIALSTSLGGPNVIFNQGQTFLAPGATLAHTATVRNNIDQAIYAQGALNVAMPFALGGAVQTYPIDYYGGEERSFRTEATVTSNIASHNASITNTVFAQLQPDNPSGGSVLITLVDTLLVSDTTRPTIFNTAVASAPFNLPYAVASVEGNLSDSSGNRTARVVLRRNGRLLLLDDISDNFLVSAEDIGAPDVACADNGNCLVVWAKFLDFSESGAQDHFEIFGALVPPTATSATPFLISEGSRSEGGSLAHDVRPAVATNGAEFMVAWAAGTSGNTRTSGFVRARRVLMSGDQAVLSPIFTLDTSQRATGEDVAWAGTSSVGEVRYIVAWAERFGTLDRIFRAFVIPAGPDTPTLIRESDSTGGVNNFQVAYDPTSQLGGMVSYIQDPGIDPQLRAVSIPPGNQGPCHIGIIAEATTNASLRLAFQPGDRSWMFALTERPSGGSMRVVSHRFAPDCQPRGAPVAYTRENIRPEGLSLACATDQCAFTGVVSTNPNRIFLNSFQVLELPPAQGALSQNQIDTVTIDNDRPIAAFDAVTYTLAALPTASVFTVGGMANDPTSGVRRVDVSVNGGDWLPATGLEAWAFSVAVPPGAGTITLRSRATDLLGHAQVEFGQATLNIVGGAPQLETALADDALLRPTYSDADLRWNVPVSGAVVNVVGGTQLVEVNVTPNGSGWQPADVVTTTAPNTWSIAYPLSAFDASNTALVDPSGAYTVTVRATDALGDTTPESQYLTRRIRLDTSPPNAALTAIGSSTVISSVTVISQTLRLSGVVSETGRLQTGVSGLEASFTDRQPITPTQTWQSATLAASGPGVFNTTWTYTVPAGLEGFYQIDARGADVADNRNEDQSAWGQWAGEVDTLAPRLAVTATHLGAGSTVRTRYRLVATDLNLTEASLQFPPCEGRASVERRYYDTEWYRANGGDPTRLHELTSTCTRPGHETTSFNVTVCDAFGYCATTTITPPGTFTFGVSGSAPAGTPSALNSVTAAQADLPPLLDAFIFEPDEASVLTTTNSIQVSGGAYARDYLRTLTVTADGVAIYTQSWAANTITDTAWSTAWTPTGEGAHTLLAVVSDWAGRVLTDASPVAVTLDTQPPTLIFTDTLVNTADQFGSRADLMGTASDAGGIRAVDVRINNGPFDDAALEAVGPGTVRWRYAWILPADGTYNVTARATDLAGRTTLITRAVAVDLTPPNPVTVTLSYLDTGSVTRPITPGQTLTNAQTLRIAWTASADANGLGNYLVGWTNNPTPDPALLTAYATSATRLHTQLAGEAQALYAHVAAQDTRGNRTWRTLGPVYVDAPLTPDFIADLNYHGWMQNTCAQIGADREVSRNAPAGAALNAVQRLYAAWSADALRLTWTGANWDTDGDLFIYLDTTTGGALTAFDPYTKTSPVIGLPPPMAADYLIWIEDGRMASLRQWTGASWSVIPAWTSQYFQLDTRLSQPHTDALIPFSLLGNPTSLRLVALASEEDALRIWAAMPDKNPLNSERVISPLAVNFVNQRFDLTQDYAWTSFGAGQCPNAGQFADADLRVSLSADPAGVTVGYLNDDFLVLAPNARLDANLDGVVDMALPVDIVPLPLGAGQTVTYTLRYANEGTQVATNVQVNLTVYGGLQLPGSNAINLGTIPAGATGTFTFTGLVTGTERSAELRAVVSDATHGDFDWLRAQHPIDRDPPTGLAIRSPSAFVRSGNTTVSGIVEDASGVREVRLEVQSFVGGTPTGALTVIPCPDASPRDGEWTCAWNVTPILGVIPSFQLRAQATDLYGNVSGLTAPVTMLLDDVPPTVTLDGAVDQALADGVLTPGEFIFSGGVQDNLRASAAVICLTRAAGQSCTEVNVQPGNTPSGTWDFAPPVFAADGITETLSLFGRDGAGNPSLAPLTRIYEIDNLGPQVVVAAARRKILLSAYLASPTPVISGTVGDANGVQDMAVSVKDPTGQTVWHPLVRNGDRWSFTPSLTSASPLGLYVLRVYAWDGVGNARGFGPFELRVVNDNAVPVVDPAPDQTTNEGSVVRLAPVTFRDNDTEDTHTATINWGDGTPVETGIVIAAGAGCPPFIGDAPPGFAPMHFIYLPLIADVPASTPAASASGAVCGTHVYADNGPADQDLKYTVTVCVTDDVGGTGCGAFTIRVENVVSTVDAGPDQAVNRGETVRLPPATFNDKGTRDTHTATIEWGDGSIEAGAVQESPFGPPGSTAGANGTVSGSHVYAAAGEFTVFVCVTDDDGAVACDTFKVTVKNAPPKVDAGPDQEADEGSLVKLAPATFTDADPQDTHTATVKWGDGTQASGIVTETPGGPGVPTTGAVSGNHVYADNGSYTVEVCVTDDGGAAGCDSLIVTVHNVAPTVDAGHDQVVYQDDPVTLDPATFNDKGTLDTHTAHIDWGDVATEDGVVKESPFGPPGSTDGANGTISGSHPYMHPGIYIVTITVADDDGGVTSDTLTVTVVHGFMRLCAYAHDHPGVTIHQDAVLDCARVPGGIAGETRPGGVGSHSRVDLKDRAVVAGNLLSLDDGVELVKGARLHGNISAAEEVELNDNALVLGDVTTFGDIELTKGSAIAGDATAGGEVNLDATSIVTGTISEHAGVPPPPTVTFVGFHLSAGTEDVRVKKGEHQTLSPGHYKNLKVEQGATLTLHSGWYAFEKFEVEKGAVVEFDLSEGPIIVDVVGNVHLMEAVQMVIVSATGDAVDILFRVGGQNVHLHKGGVYLGTFLAPDANVVLHDDAALTGALYGKRVDVMQRARVTGRPALELFIALFVNFGP